MSFVVAKAEMSGKPATLHNWPHGLRENLDKATRILAMRIATHRRLIQRDLLASGLYQAFELCANYRNQSLCNVPAALVDPSRINSSTQRVWPGYAGFEHWSGRRNLPQKLKFRNRAQPMLGSQHSCERVFSTLIVRRRAKAAGVGRSWIQPLQPPIERKVEIVPGLLAVCNHI